MLRVAQDHRPVAESPAPRNLQGGMGLHLCICCLQLGSHAKSGDPSDVSQGRVVRRVRKENLRPPADAAKNVFFIRKIAMPGEKSKSCCPFFRSLLERMYEYHRKLPHYQKAQRAVFVTFCKNNREPFPPEARDAILQHCLHDDAKRFQLHAAVVMPDHVHLLLTPLCDDKGWPYGLPAILKLIKGTSARSVNKLLGTSGPVWQEESFDHVLRSQESLKDKLEYIRQNPIRQGLAKRPEDYRWLLIEPHPR